MDWIVKEEAPLALVTDLQQQLPTVSEETIRLFINRGIQSFEDAKSFCNPCKEQLIDPFLMKNMHIATRLLVDAFSNQQKILLYGDYDVDGTCSVALAKLFLSGFGANVSCYVPDRYTEGYGVSELGVDFAIENNIALVIMMDCGVRANVAIERLKSNGIKTIVCDHHEPSTVLPLADALLDPKQIGCNYPFKELCGCGVTFKLLHAFCIDQTIPEEELFKFLDLVALATCADIVPMVNENRALVSLGLAQINNKNLSIGLYALIEGSGLTFPLAVRDLVFGCAPRINAAGRIDHAMGAVDLLTATTLETAKESVELVNHYNKERQQTDKEITTQVLETIATSSKLQEKRTTVLAHPTWSKGVVGIVASRCIEHYYKPTIIMQEKDGQMVGSARSVGNFDLLTALDQCQDLILKYGGHKFAAGLTLKKEHFDAFCNRFEEVVNTSIAVEDLEPKLNIDLVLPLNRVRLDFCKMIERLSPFGPFNQQPVFASYKVTNITDIELLKEEHLKFKLIIDNYTIDCIGFGMKEKKELLSNNSSVDLAYQLNINEYKGQIKLQMLLKDLRPSA
jgi:single-stranded-DNA-specific exonuclease